MAKGVRTPWTYLALKKGAIYWNEFVERNGKREREERSGDYVEGKFHGMRLVYKPHDPKYPNVRAHFEFQMDLVDVDQTTGEVEQNRVIMHFPSIIATRLISFLPSVSVGDRIRLEVWRMVGDEKATYCKVMSAPISGVVAPLPQDKSYPMSSDAELAAINAMPAGPDRDDRREAMSQKLIEQRKAWCMVQLEKHPGYEREGRNSAQASSYDDGEEALGEPEPQPHSGSVIPHLPDWNGIVVEYKDWKVGAAGMSVLSNQKVEYLADVLNAAQEKGMDEDAYIEWLRSVCRQLGGVLDPAIQNAGEIPVALNNLGVKLLRRWTPSAPAPVDEYDPFADTE